MFAVFSLAVVVAAAMAAAAGEAWSRRGALLDPAGPD